MDKKIVKNSYNKVALEYAQTRNQFKNLKYLGKLNSLIRPGSTILDLGCGSGKPIDEYFINKGHKIVGIDIAEAQIRLAKKNFPEHKFDVRDMDELRKGEYSIDAVVSFYAIFHIPRERHSDLFEKIYSFLINGGLMMVTMGTTDWEGEENFHGAKMQWSHYDKDKNKQIIEDSGFKILLNEVDVSGDEKHQVLMARKLML